MTHKYKKYIVFYWGGHACGGMYDIIGSFDTLKETPASATGNHWVQIVDRDTWEIVHSE